MGFFDWIFSGNATGRDAHLLSAADRVLQGIDPRLKYLSGARERLAPAVREALAFAHETIGQLPPSLPLSPEHWSATPLLRAMFARPSDISETISRSDGLRRYMESSAAPAGDTLFGVLGATRVQRRVLGAALEGDMLRQDVALTSVSFGDFRLAGFAPSEAATRRGLEDFVLEQLALAAMKEVAADRKRAEDLESYRQLLLTRLRLMEQSGAGLDTLFEGVQDEPEGLVRLRKELAINAEQLAAVRTGGEGLEAALERVIDALRNAEAIIQPTQLSLCLEPMNFLVDPAEVRCTPIELLEFSTVNPDRPRRVGFLVSFPRAAVVARHVDLDALLRSI